MTRRTEVVLPVALAVAITPVIAGCIHERVLCTDDPTAPGCETTDSGPDSATDSAADATDTNVPDAGPCGGACTGATPVCDTTTETCVACTDNTHCAAPTALCDTASNACVACLINTDCTDETTPICDAGNCRGCAADSDCTDIASTPVCDEPSGRCVECSVDTEETTCPAPDNFACHPTELTCTGAERNTLGFCEACVSDSECITNASATSRCVPMSFPSGAPHGTYCLVDQTTLSPAGPCPDLMTADRLAMSVGGEESTYCFVQENITTCEAVLGFNDLCPGGDADCGAPGLADGHCEGGTCTYECSGGRDCSSGSCTGAPTRYCE